MIRLIAAIDQQRGIAKHGVMPWHIPEDRTHFKELTSSSGGVVLMGSGTYDTIGQPLPGRKNVVLSSKTEREVEGVTFINNLESFLSGLSGDIWVIGGASIYEQTVELADELYLTHIHADFGCDQFLPVYEHVFENRQQSELHTENGFIFHYGIYGKL